MIINKNIISFFCLNDILDIELLKDGSTNKTYLITTNKFEYVLQRLHTNIEIEILKNAFVLTQFLHTNGWNVPIYLEGSNNLQYLKYKEHLWRCYKYIDGDAAPNISFFELGGFLAKLHLTLSKCSFIPKKIIPHYRLLNENIFIKIINKRHLLNFELQNIFDICLNEYSILPNIFEEEIQLIHGDTKLTNFLFTNGVPHAIIDFDTCLYGSKFYDIADTIRSIYLLNVPFKIDNINPDVKNFLSGYVLNSNYDFNFLEAKAAIFLKRLTLHLIGRFYLDLFGENWFNWDEKHFLTRFEHLQFRIFRQYELYKILK